MDNNKKLSFIKQRFAAPLTVNNNSRGAVATRACSLLTILICCATTPQAAKAEFTLNFQPIGGGSMGTIITRGDDYEFNQTPYLMEGSEQLPEMVTDPDNGQDYYHMIVGSLADGFIQEVYIRAGYTLWNGQHLGTPVGGDGGITGGNGVDPLGRDPGIETANGEADPREILIRQIVDDGEISMEFLKDQYDKKALITQTIDSVDMQSEFSLDMRNSSYNDNTTAGVIINTMSLVGTDLGSFDMGTDVELSNVTGGRYTYVTGSGPGGSAGTYEYVDGGYDIYNQDWEIFFDHSEDNPWSYSTNRPTP